MTNRHVSRFNCSNDTPPELAGAMVVVVRLTAQLLGVRWCRRIELNSRRFVQPPQLSSEAKSAPVNVCEPIVSTGLECIRQRSCVGDLVATSVSNPKPFVLEVASTESGLRAKEVLYGCHFDFVEESNPGRAAVAVRDP